MTMRQLAEPDAIPSGWRTRLPGSLVWALICMPIIGLQTFLYGIYYLRRSRRPNPRWTYRQALTTRFLNLVFAVVTDVGYTSPLSLEPGKLGDRWVLMDPAPPEAYRGELSPSSSGGSGPVTVRPERIGGTWYPGPPPAKIGAAPVADNDDDLILLYFHSGSFLWMDGRPGECGQTATLLNSKLGPRARSLWVQYRLAGDTRNPTIWPGPMQDAVTSYLYLVDKLGIPPNRIVVGGDSSGSTIAVGLLRYLATNKEAEGAEGHSPINASSHPRACIIFSPSVDYSTEGDSAYLDAHRNITTDYLTGRMLAWGASAVAPAPLAIRLDGPYLSPALHPFATPVPIFVQAGGGEVLVDTVRVFADAMASVSDNRVKFVETPDVPHDAFMLGPPIGWEREQVEMIGAAAEFVRGL